MNQEKANGPSSTHQEGSSDANKKDTIRYVCPSCFVSHELNKDDQGREPPMCDHCNEPLIKERNGKTNGMKCMDCLLSMETPAGIWCLKNKSIVTENLARNCGRFVNKRIVDSKERDEE